MASSSHSRSLLVKLAALLLPRGLLQLAKAEERPNTMLVLLGLLVMVLHGWLLLWLMQPVETVAQPKPLLMEVSMLAMTAPKPVVAAAKPLPPQALKKPTPPKKLKPVFKKPAPVVQKAPDFAPSEPVEPVSGSEASGKTDAQSSASTLANTTQADSAATFTEANYRANYAHNPKPEYPTIAKSRGWQGKVLLRVQVSDEGLSEAVMIEQSSGWELLDESALEAVKQWRFIPAKRGELAVASSVIVPIVFTLRN